MTEALDPTERAAALAGLPNWHHEAGSNAISRVFRFTSFSAAFGFMTRVALLAEQAGHHPDWSNSFNVVTIRLTTHDMGGITQKDIDLARAIDALAP